MNDAWIADRMRTDRSLGIRKAFDMSKSMKNPINLSIGLPGLRRRRLPVKAAAIRGDRARTQRLHAHPRPPPSSEDRLQTAVDAEFHHRDRHHRHLRVIGGAPAGRCRRWSIPATKVILFDPYFVMYGNLVALAGGISVLVDTYPDFRIDADKVAAAITGRTGCIVVNSPGQPDRRPSPPAEASSRRWPRSAAASAASSLISDEVYSHVLLRPTRSPPSATSERGGPRSSTGSARSRG